MSIDKMIEEAETIMIHSGEGDTGSWKTYAGTRTVRALKAELRREWCGGDRWATVWLSRDRDKGHVLDCLDIEAGEIVDTRSAT